MGRNVLVGISTYRDIEYLPLLLQSIRWYTYEEDPQFDLVVCDDGTQAAEPGKWPEVEKICAQFNVTQLVGHSENRGIPAAWNSLCRACGGDSEYIVILNNDMLMVPHWLRVAISFLEMNKGNPHIGSCYWNPVNRVPLGMMRAIIGNLAHTTYVSTDQVTGKEADFHGYAHSEVRIGEGHGLGRVMCPCGCCFAFRREVYDRVGGFREDLVSFHEECVAPDRYVVVRELTTGDIRVLTVEALFCRFASTLSVRPDGLERVFPTGLEVLSGVASTDPKHVVDSWLTPKEQRSLEITPGRADTLARTRAYKKLQNKDLHINTGVWVPLRCVARRRTEKPMVHVRNKMGATSVTTDHNLMVYDQGRLVGTRADAISERPLERVWTFPDVTHIDRIDLADFLQRDSGVTVGTDRLTYGRSPYSVQRYIDVGTPEMDALCLLLGNYISEGHAGLIHQYKNGTSARTTLTCGQELENSQIVAEASKLICDAPVAIVRHKKAPYADVYAAVCTARIMYEVLVGLCDRMSDHVRLPHFVFRLPREHQMQVWAALLRGDGFKHKCFDYYCRTQDYKDRYFYYATISRGLVNDLSVLLTIFGLKFTIGERVHPDGRHSYWIRSCTKTYGPRSWAPVVIACETPEYVYDLELVGLHHFADAEGLILVHNSLFGSVCAKDGRAAFGFSYPRPYHTHGATFAQWGELRAGPRMSESRKKYRDEFQVPDNIGGNDYFNWVHQRLMPQIPTTEMRFLSPDYSLPPVENTLLPGGERVPLPQLVIKTGTY